MTEEEKRQEKLLLLLLALSQQTENQINEAYRGKLIDVMRRLRRLIQQMSPTGQFRALEWNLLAPQAIPILEEITATLRNSMLPEIQTLLPEVQDAAFDYSRPEETEPQELQPVTQQRLLETLRIAGAGALLTMMGNRNGPNRYTLGMANDLSKTVRSMVLGEKTTQEISDKVLKLMTSKGKVVAKINTGSFANQMWARSKNTAAAVVWDAVSKQLRQTFGSSRPTGWVWNAVLDPNTCPICFPLDGQRRTTQDGFDRLPPLHANCRCAVLPTFGSVEST